jgi:kynurenine formamidase
MHTIIEHKEKTYQCDLSKPIDISIPMRSGSDNPNAFGIPHPTFEPLVIGEFVGSVAKGGSVNCENLLLNAHGNGTHTECVGHISHERITINQSLKKFFFIAQVITSKTNNGQVMTADIIPFIKKESEAIIIRTLPNDLDKLSKNYSGNNPGFLEPELCRQICDIGIKHLLVDLPSVDPEHDEGKLTAHHLFWDYPKNPRMDATISEMIYVPENIEDGIYLLNIQIASFETDASPSKPILYEIQAI